MSKNWLFFNSGTGGHWFSYVADCLVNGDYDFIVQDRHKDSYHKHVLSSERMPVLWVHPNHWKYGDLKNISRSEHIITPIVIHEPNYFWNCFQNWLIKHELFWNKKPDDVHQFNTAYKAFNFFHQWNDITNLKNYDPIIYHMIYTNPDEFINKAYSELSRTIPKFKNKNDKLFHKKIEEYKSKCKPYDTLKNTYYWYGFVFGYALSLDNSIDILHTFRTHPNGIEWFINEEYPKYEKQFIDCHVLKV